MSASPVKCLRGQAGTAERGRPLPPDALGASRQTQNVQKAPSHSPSSHRSPRLGARFRCFLSLFTSRQRTRLCSAFICPLFTHRGQYPGPVCLPVALASWKPPDRLSPSAPRLHAAASLTELLHPVLDCCLPSSSQPGRGPHTLTPWWCALQSHSADAGLESHTALLSTALEQRKQSPLVPSHVPLVKLSSRPIIKLPSYV